MANEFEEAWWRLAESLAFGFGMTFEGHEGDYKQCAICTEQVKKVDRMLAESGLLKLLLAGQRLRSSCAVRELTKPYDAAKAEFLAKVERKD
jgi:hypothetical protein